MKYIFLFLMFVGMVACTTPSKKECQHKGCCDSTKVCVDSAKVAVDAVAKDSAK
jgi:hypothetical protein